MQNPLSGCSTPFSSINGIVPSFDVMPNGIGTTWNLTVEAIEKLIAGYSLDIQKIQNGEKNITENGKTLSKEKAIAKITVLRDNWEQILEYHAKETNPF